MEDSIPLVVGVVSGTLLLVGLAADSALHNYSHSKLEKILQGDPRLKQVTQRLKYFDRYALSLLLFNTFMAVFFAGTVFISWTEPSGEWAGWVGRFFVIFLILGVVLGGLVKGVVAQIPEPVLIRLLGFMGFVGRVLFPLVAPLESIARFVGHFLGAKPETMEDEAVEEILDAVAEGEAEGALEENAADFIENIIEFKDQVVREVMTPRTSMVAMDQGSTIEEVLELIREHGHSRIPVYQDNRDNIEGIVHIKDVLTHISSLKAGDRDLRSIARTPVFVPETKNISDLLQEFQQQRVQFAVVLDEFGGTSGLVTVEDIIEEIVGEIEDEFDSDEPIHEITRLDANRVEVDAKMPIDHLNDALGLSIPDEGDYETVGGFMSATLGKVPAEGENLDVEGAILEVTEADLRKVKRIRVTTTV